MDPPRIVSIASTIGIISTTTFWSMNFTINYLTFPALLLGGVPEASSTSSKLSSRFLVPSTDNSQVSKAFLARQWQEVYWRGHRWGPPSAVLSGVAFFTAALFSGVKSNQQYLYATATVSAISVIPWTLLAMVPVNDELHRRGDAQRYANQQNEDRKIKGDDRDLMTLIHYWLFCSAIRASMALTATLAGVLASLQ